MQWGNYLGAKGPAAFLLPVSRSSSCGRKRGTDVKEEPSVRARGKCIPGGSLCKGLETAKDMVCGGGKACQAGRGPEAGGGP